MVLRNFGIAAIFCVFLFSTLQGQVNCGIALDETDEFDQTRTVVTDRVPAGYLIHSQYETADGYKLIDEGQLLFTFTRNDTLDALFLVLGLQEYTYRKISSGKNLLLLLDNKEVVGLLNFPDRGKFDKTTNMRLYLHTAAFPLDTYYKLLYHKVQKIRVMYEGYNHTLALLPEQQEKLQSYLLCLGQYLGLLPQKP